jgi:transposase-like protein
MARKLHATKMIEDGQAGLGSEDFLRGLVERVVQQVLEAEMTNFLGLGYTSVAGSVVAGATVTSRGR